ncbi:Transcription initiation factor TFIID subunit 12 [Marasmius tenuissimus]|uniref:Transcription initiation factor TFIID subunit 12 n=1 Tax=Marasmius tenuissimus TaxID=585030 RepID=A0ABR2ZF80_9AGAR
MDKAAASSSTPQAQANGNGGNMIEVLHNLLRTQTGEQMSNHKVAHLLLSNMETLVKQGKLNPTQIQQAQQHRQAAGPSTSASPTPAGTPTKPAATPAATTPVPAAGLKPQTGGESTLATLATATTPTTEAPYSINATLNTTNPGPVQWPAARPTLSGGVPSGRVLGTPTQIARTEDSAMLALDDNRSRRKSTPGDQSMRRSIQELVASIDPNVKIEPEVEDLLLSIADEFIDSVTNFSCRLARHRGSDILEVKDLQLHLERNHNIRIPGFASDDTRLSLSQSTVAPVAQAASGKKNAQGPHMTLRSQRLQQVQHAKREAKLM